MSNKTIKPGMHVTHLTRGQGTVIDEWGSWMVCRNCFSELPLRPRKWRPVPETCPSCVRVSGPLRVSGKGIFNVRFQNGVHAINQVWLNTGLEEAAL